MVNAFFPQGVEIFCWTLTGFFAFAIACTPKAFSQTPSPNANQEEEEEEEIDITVTGEILNQPVYAPFRREAPLGDSTRPVYVINREQIEAQGARTAQEALKYLPGILIDGTAGGQLGALSSQFIRGSNSAQVLILLDGRPINDVGFFGGFDLSELTTDNIERIELLPGGGSTLYGSDAIGGVINIITRSPSNKPEVALRAAAGSFGLNEQAIQTRGRSGGIGWTVGYTRTQSENDFPFDIDRINLEDRRENADVLYNNANLKLEGQLDNRNTLTFSALYLTKDFGVAGGVAIPGSIGEFNTLTPEARQYTEEVLLDLTWESKLGDGDDSLLTSRVYGDFLSYNYNNPDPNGSGTKDDVDRRAIGAQVQHNWQIAKNQTLTYGVDYRNTRSRNTTFSYGTNSTEVNYDGDISQGALFARYEVKFTPSFSVNLGLRQDFNSLVNGSFTSPSVGARLALGASTTLRANYARSFRAPQISNLEGLAAFNVVGNPDLKSERGDSFDIGIDQALGNIGLLRLTFFSNTISDLINFKFGSPSTYENIGQVRTLGLEAALNVRLARNFYGFANYTLNDPRIVRDRNPDIQDNQLSFRDADSLNFGLAYETPGRLYTGIVVRHLSSYFVNNTNTESLPGYTTVDLKLRVPLGGTVVLNGNLDNLFNQQYEQYPGYPAVGRSFRLGISATF
ncbi:MULTISPECIES: TonB-dependent receptor plug domain-containing protein [Kamptonema]|uniref:TonB-dependent receptor plug domain-containing protein n=1 Tax=Kamptonema TaxID=1501433 RepID=UPI0001DAD62A|nr:MULTISPECIES: TonB-dependent receptor [Kamptonema]CBN56573.1 TonB-dependent receptor [Kamptonema sp. PCC 6506]